MPVNQNMLWAAGPAGARVAAGAPARRGARPLGPGPDPEEAGPFVLEGPLGADAGAGGPALRVAGGRAAAAADDARLGNAARAGVGHALRLEVPVRLDARSRRDCVVLVHAGGTPAHGGRIAMAGKAEAAPGTAPAVIGMARAGQGTDVGHRSFLPVGRSRRAHGVPSRPSWGLEARWKADAIGNRPLQPIIRRGPRPGPPSLRWRGRAAWQPRRGAAQLPGIPGDALLAEGRPVGILAGHALPLDVHLLSLFAPMHPERVQLLAARPA